MSNRITRLAQIVLGIGFLIFAIYSVGGGLLELFKDSTIPKWFIFSIIFGIPLLAIIGIFVFAIIFNNLSKKYITAFIIVVFAVLAIFYFGPMTQSFIYSFSKEAKATMTPPENIDPLPLEGYIS